MTAETQETETTPEEYGVCTLRGGGLGAPVVTRADDKVLIADTLTGGANSMNAPWLRLDGNLLTIVDVTYNLVAWNGYAHVGIKVKPPRQRRRGAAPA